ncbi:hypothetical protein SLS61_001352 [Didymella pomorum]
MNAVALAAGVSAQYSAAPVSMPSPSSPSPYYQTMPASSMAASSAASKPASSMAYSASAAPSSPAGVTTTITAKGGCPTGPAPDVIVTRSNAPVPSCEAGSNATKPSIVTMPGYGPPAQSGGMGGGMSGGMGGSGNATRTGTGSPAQFTGAAGKTAVSGALAAVAGFAVYML